MEWINTLASAADTLKDYTYSKAMAAGGMGGMLYEFATERGGDLAFLFIAGALGALAGGLVKWGLERILPHKKRKDERNDKRNN